MKKILIIAEKPSVAMEICKALSVKSEGKKDGYVEGYSGITGCTVQVSWCIGHLIELLYPEAYDEKYKRWNINDLPFLPETYRYGVIKNVRSQFLTIKKLMEQGRKGNPGTPIDALFNAGDSGREGELIQRLVYEMAGLDRSIPVYRIWLDSFTQDAIINAVRNPRMSSEFDNLAMAAKERQIEDYAFGINFTRALSDQFGQEFNDTVREKAPGDKKYHPITVGRVMTCVLGMIVQREAEILNFKPTAFYKIDAEHGGFKSHWKAMEKSSFYTPSDLYKDIGFLDKQKAQALLSDLGKDPYLTVENIDGKTEKKSAPLLFNLAELQAECTSRFHLSPAKTLEIAQSLYEKKLTTYPRTDARVLSTAIARQIDRNLRGLRSVLGGKFNDSVFFILNNGLDKKIEKSRYTNDSKITDHYAIIPTGEGDSTALGGTELQVYELIVRRFLAVFYPAAEYSKTVINLRHSNGEMFLVSEKFLTSDGYLAVYQETKKEAAPAKLPPLKKGQKLQSRFSMISSETAPPKRYTSGSMILAMENAGNLIEDETLREEIKSTGIGTSATRAAVIQKLCDISYIDANKKTQVLTPTMIGIEVFKVVRKTLPAMLMPKYTASWETGLHRIEAGEMTAAAFRQTLYAYIETNIEKIRGMDSKKREPVQKRESGTCPICGATLYETEKSFICSRYKRDGSGCGFMFGKNMPGRPLKDIEIQALLSGKSTPFTNDFVSKEGKSYLARIKVTENGTCSIDFPADETSLKCPKCGAGLSMTKYSYTCGDRCGFSVYHTYSGHRLTENEFKSLIKEKIIGPLDGFRQRDGTPFSAFLIYNGKGVFICKTVIGGKTIEKKDILPLTKKKKTDYMDGFTKIRNNRAKLVIQDNGYVGMEFPS